MLKRYSIILAALMLAIQMPIHARYSMQQRSAIDTRLKNPSTTIAELQTMLTDAQRNQEDPIARRIKTLLLEKQLAQARGETRVQAGLGGEEAEAAAEELARSQQDAQKLINQILDNADKERAAAQQELANVRANLDNANKRIDTLRKQKDALEKQRLAIQQQRAVSDIDRRRVQQLLDQERKISADLRAERDRLAADIVRLNQRINALLAQQGQLLVALAAAVHQGNLDAQAAQRANQALVALREEYDAYQLGAVEAFKVETARYNALRDNQDATLLKLDQTTKALAAARGEVARLVELNAEQADRIARLGINAEEMMTALNGLRAQNIALRDQVRLLQENNERQKALIRNLEEQLKQQPNKAQQAALNQLVDAMRAENKRLVDDLAQRVNQVGVLEGNIKQLEAALGTANNEIKRLQADLQNAQADLEKKCAANQKEVAAAQANAADAIARLRAAQAKGEATEALLQQAKANIAALQLRLDAAQQLAQLHQQAVQQIQALRDANEQLSAQAQADQKQLQDQIAALEKQLAGAQANAAAKKVLEDRLKQLTAALADAAREAQANREAIRRLAALIEQAEKDKQEHDKHMQDAQTYLALMNRGLHEAGGPGGSGSSSSSSTSSSSSSSSGSQSSAFDPSGPAGKASAIFAQAQEEQKRAELAAAQERKAKEEEVGLGQPAAAGQADALNQWADDLRANAASRSKLQSLANKYGPTIDNFRDANKERLSEDQRKAMQSFVEGALQAGKNINRNSVRALRASINQLTAAVNARKGLKQSEKNYGLSLDVYAIWKPVFDAFNEFGIPGLVPLVVMEAAGVAARKELLNAKDILDGQLKANAALAQNARTAAQNLIDSLQNALVKQQITFDPNSPEADDIKQKANKITALYNEMNKPLKGAHKSFWERWVATLVALRKAGFEGLTPLQ